ncbi:GntR family transcriptional regulator [Streptomyces sp. 846.5]|nr:GntR family transcriptional regulator [Streptomyces sp. 846.5]TDU05618.1 GntR family transcriptional regulator [Streptomyces sp. 846.5]
MDIIRNEPLYKQVASVLRQAIADGEYPPNGPLPSEAVLADRYKVSRPTVRQAVASLRSEGLVDVIMGKGSFVRATATGTAHTVERTVTKTGAHYATPADTWTEIEPPNAYRTATDATTAPLLGLDEDEETITVDRTLVNETTGARYLQRVTIPMATAAGTTLADQPARPVAELYAALAAAGHKPAWTETVHARMPHPDERSALRIPDAAPLLLLRRVTHDATTGQPLILEELRTGAEGTAVSFAISPQITRRGDRRGLVSERPELDPPPHVVRHHHTNGARGC